MMVMMERTAAGTRRPMQSFVARAVVNVLDGGLVGMGAEVGMRVWYPVRVRGWIEK